MFPDRIMADIANAENRVQNPKMTHNLAATALKIEASMATKTSRQDDDCSRIGGHWLKREPIYIFKIERIYAGEWI
jgi:hypothetical protein